MELPNWVPVIESKPAPGDLLLLQAFINTFEADTTIDVLSDRDPDTANGWLHDAGLLPDGIHLQPATLVRTQAVREALRSLLVHNAGHGAPPAAAIELLTTAAQESVLRLTFNAGDEYQVRAETSGPEPLGGIVLRLMLIIRDAQISGTWERLKACSNEECRWAYYDRSHSHKGRWCDMATCGNRIKNRELRARQR